MRALRFRILALLAVVPIILGLLVPAVAAPCVDGAGAANSMSCDFCLVGGLPGATICASACQAVQASGLPAALPQRHESQAWFGEFALNPRGFETPPDSPPPR